MKKNYLFCVADSYFLAKLPPNWHVSSLLPSFLPFICPKETVCEDLLFSLTVSCEACMESEDGWIFLEESDNDFGHVEIKKHGESYRIEISYDAERRKKHIVKVNSDFRTAEAFILINDFSASIALTSILRMLFAQTILRRGGVSLHASCVSKDHLGFLFLGKSGTGKSTHSALWRELFPDCSLLNDDNPVIRLENDEVWVYGSPWSGKTPCYRPECYRVGGIVRLEQHLDNQFQKLREVAAFTALLPSCSLFGRDQMSQQRLYDILISVTEMVPIGHLSCLPNREAAQLCYEELLRMRV